MTCPYCEVPDGKHHKLCPLTSIERDPNRLVAYRLNGEVATSDWVDSLVYSIDRQMNPFQRDRMVAAWRLYHRWVERQAQPKDRDAA